MPKTALVYHEKTHTKTRPEITVRPVTAIDHFKVPSGKKRFLEASTS